MLLFLKLVYKRVFFFHHCFDSLVTLIHQRLLSAVLLSSQIVNQLLLCSIDLR